MEELPWATKCTILDTHDHLLHYPPTKQEQRSMKEFIRLTNGTEVEALEFVRVFYWHIAHSEGGVYGVIKKLRAGSLVAKADSS